MQKTSEEVKPTKAEPRDGYSIWLRYSDGTSGEIDLSHLAGDGVFKIWDDRDCFEAVYITSYGAVAWGKDIELCPDALYMQLTGKPIAVNTPYCKCLSSAVSTEP